MRSQACMWVNTMSVPLVLLILIGIFIPFPLYADTEVYDKNWNLQYRIENDGKIYDKEQWGCCCKHCVIPCLLR